MTISVFHINRDLDVDTRLSVTSPLVPNFKEAFEDGTYDEKKTALRVEAARKLLDKKLYDHVATVDADLEGAYRLTQNLDKSWSMNPHEVVSVEGLGYIAYGDRKFGYKSSECGDVFRDDATGEFYVVDTFGFAKL